MIGYDPPGMELSEEWSSAEIAKSDFCMRIDEEPKVGMKLYVSTSLFNGDRESPGVGTLWKVVKLEHRGKVVYIEQVQAT